MAVTEGLLLLSGQETGGWTEGMFGRPCYNAGCHEPVNPADILLDPEFATLLPPSAPEEEKALQEALFRDGCREALVVWPWQGRLILLVGYEQFPLLRLYRLPFTVVEKACASRADARMFIIQDQLARKNLTPLAVSYLRGLRYLADKQPHGGDRRSAAAGPVLRQRKTAEALAEIFHVDAATIRRDGEFAAAVNALAAACGEDVKRLILSRGAKLSRCQVLKLGKLPAEELRAVVTYVKQTGHVPRSWANHGVAATITLPSDPEALAKELVRRCGAEYAGRVAAALAAVLAQGAST
jgi:hypothetical protein